MQKNTKSSEMTDYIREEYTNTVIPILSKFIEIPNQSREFDPSWATNGMQKKAATFALDWAKTQGLQNVKYHMFEEENRTPCIMVTIDATESKEGKTVFMYGHLDKQPPLTEKWSDGIGPYTPVIKDGKLYGRGGVDDGYSFFSCILLIKALQKFNVEHNRIVLYFETDEESGSKDLVYFLKKNEDLVGTPDIIFCLDSGTYDYEHFCLTTALRGVMNFSLSVDVTKKNHDSGLFNHVIPDATKLLRKALTDFQDIKTGKVIKDFYVKVPKQKEDQVRKFVEELGGKVDFGMPILDGVDYLASDPFELVMNNVWRPSLTMIGRGIVPDISSSGEQLRSKTEFRLSLRLPPTLNPEDAKKSLKNFFENYKGVEGAKFNVYDIIVGGGFSCPEFKEELVELAKKAALDVFNKNMLYLGVGGSIPFMNELIKIYPKSQFFITGTVGPGANIHAPDENFDIEYGTKLFQTIALFLQSYAKLE